MLQEGSGEVLWENSVEYMGLRESSYSCFEIRTLPGKKSSLDREVVLAAVSNKAALFDVKDGTKIREITLSDWIISVDEQDKEETFVRVNGASGAQYNFDCNSDTYSGIAFFGDQVDNVYFVHARNAYDGVSQFLVNNGYVIRVLKAEQGDDDYTLFGFETPETELPTWYILGSTLVMADDNDKLYAYDMESEEKLWETQLDSEYYYDFLGLSKDHSRLFLTTSEDYNRCDLICVDLVQGSAEKINITENDFMTGVGKWKFDCSNSIVSGDYIYYRALNYNSRTSYWFRYSMADGSIAIVKLPYYEDIQYSTTRNQESAAVFAEDGSRGILYFDYAVYLADFKSGTVTAIDASISGVKLEAYREKDGMFAFYEQVDEGESRKEIHVFDAAGKPMWESRNLSEGITAMIFCRDSLIVATDNNRLYAYSAKNGKQEGMIEIGITISQNKAHLHDMGGSSLVLENGYGVMFMIDCENWALTGAAYDTVGFCPELKRVIITSGSSGRNIGYCPYYSVEALVEKGKAFVGEQTLSEEDRAVYGLE